MGLVAKIWNEIRGNLLWQILVWIAGGGLLTALTQGVKLYQGHPMEWKVVGLMFVISTLALAVIVLLAVRRKVPAQQQSNQALATVALNTQLSIDEAYFAIEASHRRSIEEPLRAEIGMIPIDAGNRENYLVRSLIISILALDFMQIWIYIYGSQIQALEGLNKGGLTREAISGYYTFAATVYPLNYMGFTFDNWLAFLRNQGLAVESGDRIVILPKGRDFLKWLINTGRSSSDRLY